MPITVTAPRGVLTAEGEREVLPRLTSALVAASGQSEDPAFAERVGGTVHVLDSSDVYAGGRPSPLVLVELKLPAVGLASLEARAAFIRDATDIVDELTVEGHDRVRTWVNVLNAPDGAWGVGGVSLTNAMLTGGA